MASSTPTDTGSLPDNNNPLNQKITLEGINIVFQKFLSDLDGPDIDIKEITNKLWCLLVEESHNSPDNPNAVKPEMKEVQHDALKNLSGDANPIKDQLIEKNEQNQNESENSPQDHQDNREKNDKESKEPKEPKDSKEKEKKDKEKDLTEKLKAANKQIKSMEKYLQERDTEWNKAMQERDTEWKKVVQEREKKLKEIEKILKETENKWKESEIEWNREFKNMDNHIVGLNKEISGWKESHDRLEEQLKNKRKDYMELYKKNEELKNEASQYQSALGDARNYRLGDNDANNPTQLTKEIGVIQEKINDFCKLKGGVEINEQNLAHLLSERFKCKYDAKDKVLPKAALQHLIIDTILRRTDDYIKKGSQLENNDNRILNKYLELEILNSTNVYLSKVKTLIDHRDGTDEVSSAAPKKIQQLVYAVLGDRGFGLDGDKREHEFVQELKNEIIGLMSQFRTIKKTDKRKENEDMIADIIKSVIKMFVFRIRVLEPPAEIVWITKDTKVDPTLMEVGNLEDENYDDWIVNLCSFPLICVNSHSETERKVLVPAKILAVKTEQKSLGSKMKNMFSTKSQQQQQQQPPPQSEEAQNKKNSMDS